MARYLVVNEQDLAVLAEAASSLRTVADQLNAALTRVRNGATGQLVMPEGAKAPVPAPPRRTAQQQIAESTIFDRLPAQPKYKISKGAGQGWAAVIAKEFPEFREYSLTEMVERLEPLVEHSSESRKPRDSIRRALDRDARFERLPGSAERYRRIA